MSLEAILAKNAEKMRKLEEREQNIKDGKKSATGFKTVINAAQAAEKAQQKAREAFVKDALEKRDLILGSEIPFNRILECLHVSRKAYEEAGAILQAAKLDKEGYSLRLNLYVHNLKQSIAEYDIDNVAAAVDNFEAFNEDIRKYILELLQEVKEIDPAKVKELWGDNITPTNLDVLTRGTTIYWSIDWHKKNCLEKIKTANSVEEINAADTAFNEGLVALFNKYNIPLEILDQQ
jgi:cell division septum initiation protein DivIVA